MKSDRSCIWSLLVQLSHHTNSFPSSGLQTILLLGPRLSWAWSCSFACPSNTTACDSKDVVVVCSHCRLKAITLVIVCPVSPGHCTTVVARVLWMPSQLHRFGLEIPAVMIIKGRDTISEQRKLHERTTSPRTVFVGRGRLLETQKNIH